MNNIKIKQSITIREALKILHKTAQKCLIVVDDKEKLLGTLTDGDLRASILRDAKLDKTIIKLYNPNPIFIIKKNYKLDMAKKTMLKNKISLIPIIDDTKRVIDYVTWDSAPTKIINGLNIPVVIMAGGKGSRMKPFTNVLPKPLIPIQNKTVIEKIIENFTDLGCTDFYLTVNYKAKIIKAYFEDMNPKYRVNFTFEDKPLGTAGSLKLIKQTFKVPFFVSNCDIIIKSDYNSFYNFHLKNNFDITLIASAKEFVIPYGTCLIDKDGNFSKIHEKPKFDFLVNTGLYIINPNVLDLIPNGRIYHITNLIDNAKKSGKKIGVFPIDSESWIDVGQWSEYRRAIELL